MSYTVVIKSKNRLDKVTAEEGSILLDVLRKNRIEIFAPCGGNGTCSKCKAEVKGAGTVLACQFSITGNISVELPRSIEMEVLLAQYNNTLSIPFQKDPTAVLCNNPLGVAIDLGTTTIAFYLVNMNTGVLLGAYSATNNQSNYGADIISRINHCALNKGGTAELQDIVVNQVNTAIEHLTEAHHGDPASVTRIMITGNNTMLHIFSGTNPTPLALAPFTPVFTDHRILNPGLLGIHTHPAAEIHLLPSVSAYVGSDTIAGIASLSEDVALPYLYIDIGTNGEIALVDRDKIWCCAAAAGPAFEGANISCGSGAVPGAISAFSGDGFTTISDLPPSTICGSGLIDIVSYLLETCRLKADGTMEEDFIVSPAENNAEQRDIRINQKDIREVQLAKGAIAAGISILLKASGYVFNDVSQMFIAGGFGNFMNMQSALKIGLIPLEMKGKTELIGNAAGTGSTLSLKSTLFIKRMEECKARTEYIELSYNEDFPLEFALGMNF